MVLAGFVRGQLSVCLILGAFYAVALMAIGLQFGFLVGLVAGLISFIPYVGSIVGLVLSVGIALFQFWDDKFWILATAGIFFFGQFVEGNILSPEPDRQVGGAASGLADPGAVGLRRALRLRRAPGRGAGGGGARA